MTPGGSWKTTVTGYLQIAAAVIGFIADTVAKSGLPDTILEWVVFIGLLISGLTGILSKDFDRTNSSHPQPVARAAPPPS